MLANTAAALDAERLVTTAEPRLPIHVLPLPQEALISWLSRLGQKLKRSIGVYEPPMLGLSNRRESLDWWRRPSMETLTAIAARVAVPVPELRSMTFWDWAAVTRDDELNERFGSRWYGIRFGGEPRARRIAICQECISDDEEPYLRLAWTLGWVAVCARHGTVLQTRCPSCNRKLRMLESNSIHTFSVRRCQSCGAGVESGTSAKVNPHVLKIHDLLCRGKRSGVTKLPGVGNVTWAQAVIWVDRLLGLYWRNGELWSRYFLAERIKAELGSLNDDASMGHPDRYQSLVILTWLLEAWPRNFRIAAGELGGEFRTAVDGGLEWLVLK